MLFLEIQQAYCYLNLKNSELNNVSAALAFLKRGEEVIKLKHCLNSEFSSYSNYNLFFVDWFWILRNNIGDLKKNHLKNLPTSVVEMLLKLNIVNEEKENH